MTIKKAGKIILLLQIPSMLILMISAIQYEMAHGRDSVMPGAFIWLGALVSLTITSFMMMEQVTPLQLYRNLIKFINE